MQCTSWSGEGVGLILGVSATLVSRPEVKMGVRGPTVKARDARDARKGVKCLLSPNPEYNCPCHVYPTMNGDVAAGKVWNTPNTTLRFEPLPYRVLELQLSARIFQCSHCRQPSLVTYKRKFLHLAKGQLRTGQTPHQTPPPHRSSSCASRPKHHPEHLDDPSATRIQTEKCRQP